MMISMGVVFDDGSSPLTYYHEDTISRSRHQEFNEFCIFEDEDINDIKNKKKRRQVKPLDLEDSQPLYAFIDAHPRLNRIGQKSRSQEIIDKDLKGIIDSRPGMVIIDSWQEQ